jgi:hypothetical protein
MAQVWNNDGNYYYDDAKTDAAGNALPAAGTTDWGDWLAGEGGNANARSYTRLKDYMSGLSKDYGLGANDFIKGFQSYGAQYNPGATDEYGNIHGFGRDPNMGWWGEDAMIRALGQGLDSANPNAAYKGTWNNLWNQQRELGQQNEIATTWQQNQDRFSKANDFIGTDLPMILGGLGLVAGVGGLAGAFGGASSGLSGAADVIGSDFAAGVGGSLGGVAGDVAAAANTLGGTVAPGWASAEGGAGYGAAADAAAGGVGSFVPAEAAGGTVTGSGGDMSLWDDVANALGNDTSGVIDPGNAWNGAMDTGGSDWASGLDTAMNAGNQGATGFLDQAKSLLSQGKNIPTSLVKSLFGTDDATSASIAKLIGTGLGGLLDYNASSKSAEALKEIADRSWNAGQPYRDRANAAMTPGFDIKSIPGLSSAMDTATDTYLRRLSATNGNPAGVGGAPSQTQAFVLGNVALPAWQNYFNANSNAGGLSNLSAQANSTATQAAGADAATYGSLGQTARNIFDPQPDNSRYLNLLAKAYGLA